MIVYGVWGEVSGVFPSAYPTQTTAESSGVYPANQASWLLSVLPVFPATGRPMRACWPVPRRVPSVRVAVTCSTTEVS